MCIAIAGSILVDKINELEKFPNIGELAEIKSVSRAVGGCVPNVAADLKALAPDLAVKAIGRVGDDAEGEFVIGELKKRGVDTDGIFTDRSAHTSFSEVMSIRGSQRTFFTYTGASAEFGCDDIDIGALEAKMLHLGYFLLLAKIDGGDGRKLLEEAKKHGVITSIDLVSSAGGGYEKVLSCLEFVDNLIINEAEASGLTCEAASTPGQVLEAARSLKITGVIDRVIVHSPDFAVCVSPRGELVLPSFDLPSGFIKGTTGAGDAFCAGCLLGIYEGKNDREILEEGFTAATAALTCADAVSGVGNREKNAEIVKNFRRKNICL